MTGMPLPVGAPAEGAPTVALATMPGASPELMDRLVDKIVTEDLNVRQAEAA